MNLEMKKKFEKDCFFNLNVNNNSNLSFSLVKTKELINFCLEKKIKNVSVCDYEQYDFIKFYFLCKEKNLTPIWGIKKKITFLQKEFLISIFPTSYLNYKFLNNFFYAKKIKKFIDFNFISKDLIKKNIIVFEAKSSFDFKQILKIRYDLIKNFGDEISSYLQIGLNFIPKNTDLAFEKNSWEFILPFFSIKCLSEKDKEYLFKFRSICDSFLKNFENEDINQNYFHYLTKNDLSFLLKNESFLNSLIDNLLNFISKIKISIRKIKDIEKESDFLELEKKCFSSLEKLKINSGFEFNRYKEILIKELEIIKIKKYSKYFNTLENLVKVFKESEIEIGPGRGSSVSSLVSFLLNITQIDPVKNNLYFWRFLNEKRNDYPDIDIDVNDQPKAIQKIVEKFGNKFVSRMTVKKKIGFNILVERSLKEFISNQEDQDFILKNINSFSNYFETNFYSTSIKELKIKKIVEENSFYFEFLKVIRKINFGFSVHPSGFIIFSKDLSKIIPVSKAEEVLTCSYSSYSLEKLGFKKFDFLSLTESLNFIKFMKKKFPQIPDYREVYLNDFKTWNLLSDCLVFSVFQLSSKISRYLLLKLEPRKIEDLTLLISLSRPGASMNLNSVIKNKFEQQKKNFLPLNFIEKITFETYGSIVFEEQLSMILSFCLSLDIYESENLRKSLKSIFQNKEEILKFKKFFMEKSSEKISFEDRNLAFKKIIDCIPYIFNKAHAVSYSYLTYYISYIKANFFEDSIIYMLDKSSSIEDSFFLFSELFLRNYEIVKPEINGSFYGSIIKNNKVLVGFSNLANSNQEFFEFLIKNRSKFGKFKNFRDFLDRNINILSKKFERILPWVDSGLLRSLDFRSSQIIENFDFFVRYIEIKKNLFITNNNLIPFFDNSGKVEKNFLYSKMSAKDLNEKEVLSINCHFSYFSRWNKINLMKKIKIFSFQNLLKKSTYTLENFNIYSILKGITKNQNGFFIKVFDINQIFEIYSDEKTFKKYEKILILNSELIFNITIFQNSFSDFMAKLNSIEQFV